jgi:uracil-DNA glycosylase family 4
VKQLTLTIGDDGEVRGNISGEQDDMYEGYPDDYDMRWDDDSTKESSKEIGVGDVAGCDCDKCGLLETCRGPVPDDGGDYTVLVVGEAPGAEEDEEGVPFIGRSGRLLRRVLAEAGFPMDKVTFTNVVRCRPPENKIKPKYVKACYQGLPIKDNTELVLLMGNTPLNAVLGEKGITTWNGVVVERDGIAYVPLFHPAYLLRNDAAMNDWLKGMLKALDAWEGGILAPADEHYEYFIGCYRRGEVLDMCAALMQAPVISFDTEVAMLDAYNEANRMLVISFATEDQAWSLTIDHPDDLCAATEHMLKPIKDVLRTHQGIVGHNIKFDQMQAAAMLGVEFEAYGDSMLLSFLYDSQRGIHSLKRLAGYFLGMFDYDEELAEYVKEHKEADPRRGGSYAAIPLDKMLPYAGLDASATWLLHDDLLPRLTAKQAILYRELIVPLSNSLARIQCNGIAIDYDVAERYRRLYSTAHNKRRDAILADKHVARLVDLHRQASDKKADVEFEFNPASWQQKAMVLYGFDYASWIHAKYEDDDEVIQGDLEPSEAAYKREPEWAIQDYYGLKPNKYSDTGNPSTSREALLPYRKRCPLVDHFVMYGMLQKMLGTYIEPIANRKYASTDGRIRASFNMHTVATGRLSSSNPNMQNIPTPEKEPGTIFQYQPIKNMFTHTWTNQAGTKYERVIQPSEWIQTTQGAWLDVNDGYIMCVDYAGMELRVFASLAGCQAMLDIHASGADFHSMVGSMIAGKPADQITKEERYKYKWTNWTLLYGGGAGTLHKMYGIPMAEADRTVAEYYHAFPEVLEYKEDCVTFTRQHGYIETPYGRRRPIPEINEADRGRRNHAEREAVNTPVQSTASDTLVLALTIIDQLMYEQEFKSLMVNTVHDEIVFDVYPGELRSLAFLCRDVMENVVHYAKAFTPGLDLSWLKCPLKTDVEIGSHYGALMAFEED